TMEQATIISNSARIMVEYTKPPSTLQPKNQKALTIIHIPVSSEMSPLPPGIMSKDHSSIKRMESIGCSTVKDNAAVLCQEVSHLLETSIKSVLEFQILQVGLIWIRM